MKVRAIAFYLPQFHPIPENDLWWGRGFTEWTNVAKAKPLFRGHYQPHIPADLGFYDLRVPEVRDAQAEMAKQCGIEGFCYYHYWFAGKRLLERPFNEVLQSKQPDFPFCLCWANESWSGTWHGAPDKILIEQTYPGKEDEIAHFEFLLKAFSDERYIKVEGKPLFIIYRPKNLPEPERVTDHWRNLAHQAGLKGIFLAGIGYGPWEPQANGFDGSIVENLFHNARKIMDPQRSCSIRLKSRLFGHPSDIYEYADAIKYFYMEQCSQENFFPCMIPNWDNTPRNGRNGIIFHNSSPCLFQKHAEMIVNQVLHKPFDKRVVFVKSWNEWAEGNHLEPDLRYGHEYLEALSNALNTESIQLKTPLL